MIDGWNEKYIERLQELGVSYLYHITDKDNLHSILKERRLLPWKKLCEDGIIVPRPGGNGVTHRLDARKHQRDNCVHLYAAEPTADMIDEMLNNKRFSELCVLRISLKSIRSNKATFWIGDPYLDGERFDNLRDLVLRLSDDPSCISRLSVDLEEYVYINYIDNIPKDVCTRISEVHPTAIVFVIDQSCSMARGTNLDNVNYDYTSDLVAEAVNLQIESFLKRCVSEDGTISHLYDIAVVGYGNNVSPAWNGDLSDEAFHGPMELMTHIKDPGDQFRWVNARDNETRGRCDLAFEYVYHLLKEWTAKEENKFSFPPTVVHISDGEVKREYQESFLLNAEKLKSLHTETGNVTVWNIGYLPVRFKEHVFLSGEELPAISRFPGGLVLYEASSYLPQILKSKASSFHKHNPELARKTMAVNVKFQTLFDILQMCVLPR